MPSTFIKDPDAALDYKFDFAALTNGSGDSDWLASGETISSYEVTVDDGLTLDSDSLANSDTSVVAWLSGGTAGSNYKVTCAITTSEGRTDELTMVIKVRER